MSTRKSSEGKSFLVTIVLIAGAVMAFWEMGFWGVFLIVAAFLLGRISRSNGSADAPEDIVGNAARNLDLLASDVRRDIMSELEAGRKIEAIKIARMAAGIGLKEAKELVEYLQDEGGPDGPAQGSSVRRSSQKLGR